MVFADSKAFLGEQVRARVVHMDSTIPIPGATVKVYRGGKLLRMLVADENGVVVFPADALGVFTYEAEEPTGLKQYNDPTTVVFAPEQASLRGEEAPVQTPPGGLTGLFTATSGSWIAVLLAALFAYAGYRNYAAKNK